MIFEVPVLYRAGVLEPRRRIQREVMLRAWTPVSVPEIDPDLVLSVEQPAGVDPEQGRWWTDGTGLLCDSERAFADLGRCEQAGHVLADGPAIAALPSGGPASPAQAFASRFVGRLARLSVVRGHHCPFLSDDAMRGGDPASRETDEVGRNHYDVLDETHPLRSIVPFPADARDIAIVHARAAARGLAVHARTGRLLQRARPPLIALGAESDQVLAELPLMNGNPHLYEVLDTSGIERARRIMDLAPSSPAMDVRRPELLARDPSGERLVTAVGVLAGLLPETGGRRPRDVLAVVGRSARMNRICLHRLRLGLTHRGAWPSGHPIRSGPRLNPCRNAGSPGVGIVDASVYALRAAVRALAAPYQIDRATKDRAMGVLLAMLEKAPRR